MKLILFVIFMISTNILAQSNMFAKTFREFAEKAFVDAASIEKTITYLQLEEDEIDRKETTARLKNDIYELENTLISFHSTINPPTAEFKQILERRELVAKMLTLRFHIALERYMLHYSNTKTEKKVNPNKPNQPTSQSSEVDR